MPHNLRKSIIVQTIKMMVVRRGKRKRGGRGMSHLMMRNVRNKRVGRRGGGGGRMSHLMMRNIRKERVGRRRRGEGGGATIDMQMIQMNPQGGIRERAGGPDHLLILMSVTLMIPELFFFINSSFRS